MHQLVRRVERALDAEQYALGVFFDIQSAFDNTSIVSVKEAMRERKVIDTVRNWISAVIEQRTVCTRVGEILIRVATQRGLLFPTLWTLIADSLLRWLTK